MSSVRIRSGPPRSGHAKLHYQRLPAPIRTGRGWLHSAAAALGDCGRNVADSSVMTSSATDKIPAEIVRQPSRTTRARHLIALFRKKKRILLLDDDPSMQRLAKAILLREGFRVDVFLTGRQAMAAIAGRKYDALLLDLMMPHEGGLTVIRHLREKNPALLRRVLPLSPPP